MMILKGKVKAKAIETYKLGLASGTVILMAAGTAIWLFGLCYAMDGGYKGCNPYIERHLAIFVNYF